mgnify:FL=1
MLLIGSQALKYYTKLDRDPRDWDFIGTIDEIESFIRARKDEVESAYPSNEGKKMIVKLKGELPIEFEIAWEGSTAEKLLEIVKDENAFYASIQPYKELLVKTNVVLGELVLVPLLSTLYELKMSHRFLKNSPHFLKTMRDIQLMRSLGAQVEHPEWLKEREKETYNYSHPKLSVSKDEFFKKDDGQVVYIYDHDTIHIAMARFDKPAYEYFKPEGSQVLCDKKMFFDSPEEIKLASVIEEATVLALERSQIPYKGLVEPLWSFKMALFKVCTSITSGYWREYAWEHYNEALSLYDDQYVEKFWKAVDAGIVKKL